MSGLRHQYMARHQYPFLCHRVASPAKHPLLRRSAHSLSSLLGFDLWTPPARHDVRAPLTPQRGPRRQSQIRRRPSSKSYSFPPLSSHLRCRKRMRPGPGGAQGTQGSWPHRCWHMLSAAPNHHALARSFGDTRRPLWATSGARRPRRRQRLRQRRPVRDRPRTSPTRLGGRNETDSSENP